MSHEIQQIVVDTTAFFGKINDLRNFIAQGKSKLCTIDLVVFEFTKLMQAELRGAKSDERSEMLIAVRDRFPRLLSDLGIEIINSSFGTDDLLTLYQEIADGQDAGDGMIWLKMQKLGLKTILTQNSRDWKRLGAEAVSLPG